MKTCYKDVPVEELNEPWIILCNKCKDPPWAWMYHVGQCKGATVESYISCQFICWNCGTVKFVSNKTYDAATIQKYQVHAECPHCKHSGYYMNLNPHKANNKSYGCWNCKKAFSILS